MSRIINAWNYRCPRCRRHPLFKEPFEFGNPLDMHVKCGVCGQNFEPEPGYYYGAMFISYAISVFLLLPAALLLVFYFKWTVNAAMATVIFLGMIFFIRILRFSRSLWINLMVKYDERYSE